MLRELDTALKTTQGDLTKTAQALSSIVASQRAAAKGAKELADAQVAQARVEGMAITNANKVAESNARVAESEARRQRSIVLTQQAIERKAAAEARASAQTEAAAAAVRRSNESLSDSRYLLYDVGATYGVLAAGMLALPAATTAVAVSYQKDFAQVIRTTGEVNEQTGALRQSLKDMATDIPVAFSGLSEMASLGGQLNIPKEELDEFTESVAKMVATTNLSVEEGGTLFGRLKDSFTDQGAGVEFYNKIGSAIAEVGVNSVATETEIAALMNQIGSISASVGFTAQETVGLAGALASLRVRPELARGTLTAVFTDLNRAVETGGPKLRAYSELMGMTQQETAKLWKQNPAEFFDKFAASLQKANEAGQLTSALDGIGVKQRRDTAMLTKLAVGYDVLASSMDNANTAYANGTALDEMSGPVFETIAAKLQTLASALKNLMDSVGGEGLGPIGALFDAVQWGVEGFTKLVDTVPGLSKLLQLLLGFGAIAGIFLGLKAAQAFVLAGLVGFQQVAGRQVISTSMSLTGIIRQLGITFLMMGGQSRQAATDLMATRGAMGATAVAADRLAASTARAGAGMAAAMGRVRGFGSALSSLAGGPIGIAVAALALMTMGLAGVSAKAKQAQEDVANAFNESDAAGAKALAEALSTKPEGFMQNLTNGFATNGKSVADIAKDMGVGLDTLTQAAMGSAPALDEVQEAMNRFAQSKGFDNAAELLTKGKAGALFTPDSKGAYEGLKQVSNALTDYKTKTDETKQTTNEVESALSSMGLGAEDSADGIGVGTDAIDDMNSSLKALMESIFGVLNNEAALNEALSKLGESVYDSGSFDVGSEGGRENIANLQSAFQAAQKNFMDLAVAGQMSTQEAAAQYAAFVDGLIQQVRDLGGDPTPIVDLANQTKDAFANTLQQGMPASVPVSVDAEAAKSELDAIQAQYGTLDAQVLVEEHGAQEAANRVVALQGVVGEVTGQVYTATVDADTEPANTNVGATRNYLWDALLKEVFRGVVDFDISAAVQNLSSLQNFAIAVTNMVGRALGSGGKAAPAAGKRQQITEDFSPKNAPKAFAAPAPIPAPASAAAFAPATAALGALTDGYGKAANAANKAGGAGKKAGEDAKSAAEEAAEAVEDYANRLKKALTSAYEQQYGMTDATDAYYSQLNSINKKREDELKTLEDLLRTQKELNNARDEELVNARKAEIERDISLKYGEGDRAADYGNQAQTARDNAAAKQAEIEANRKEYESVKAGIDILTGYSDAAIQNRENLRSLEQKMLDMVVAYANTGASQKQVDDYTRRLTGQFNTQVGQLGFNRQAVQNLTGDTGRYIDAINRVPYRVHTEASNNFGSGAGQAGGLTNAINGIPGYKRITVDFTMSGYSAFMGAMGSAITAADRLSRGVTSPGARWYNQGGLVQGFADGGLIPGKSPSDPREDNLMASVDGRGLIKVRSEEFIQPEPAVKFYGLDFMNKVRTMQLPRFAAGGSPSAGRGSGGGTAGLQVVALDAETLAGIQRLADRPVNLMTDSVLLASTVNEGNTILAHTGAN